MKKLIVILLLLFGCMQGSGIPAVPPSLSTHLIDSEGKEIGIIGIMPVPEGLMLRGGITLPSGVHSMHVHETGKCDVPDFKSAGAHYNPAGKKHGLKNPEGPHAGDLPNISANDEGYASVHVITTLKLDDLRNRALVIHEKADDDMTDPSGNSGARIACGVIE